MVGDATNALINRAGDAIGHNPRLGSGSWGTPSQAIQRGIDSILPKPENTGEKVGDFVGSVVAGGAGRGVDPLMRAATKFMPGAAAPALTPRQQSIAEAQKAGYVFTPSQAEGGVIGTSLEGLGGKRAMSDLAAKRNQSVTDQLAKSAAGLPADAPLTNEVLNTAIKSTYDAGYEPIKQLGQLSNGSVYRKALDKVLTDFQGASASFPAAVKADVKDLVDSYRVTRFDSKDAVDAIQHLRDGASAAYAAGNNNLAKASTAVSQALEDSIANNLRARGKDGAAMLQQFQDARTQLAKQYMVRNAIKEGTGSVNALKIAAKLQSKPGLLTDELKQIGTMGSVAPHISGMPSEQSTPMASNLGGIPTAVAGWLGGPGAAAGVAGAPFARGALRHSLLMPPSQRMLGPRLDPNILARLGHNPSVLNAMPTAVMQSGLYGD